MTSLRLSTAAKTKTTNMLPAPTPRCCKVSHLGHLAFRRPILAHGPPNSQSRTEFGGGSQLHPRGGGTGSLASAEMLFVRSPRARLVFIVWGKEEEREGGMKAGIGGQMSSGERRGNECQD